MISTIVRCLQRPSLLLIEVAWRWCAGIPTVWLLLREGGRIFNSVSLAQTGILQFSLLDQTQSTYEVMRCVELLAPPVYATAKWLAPLMMAIWAIASGVGRVLILWRTDKKTFAIRWNRIGTVIALQAARVVGLSSTLWMWLAVMQWSGDWAIVQPMQGANPDPNLVGYFGALIIVTLALFTLWAVVSWVFNAAPMLAVAENYGFIRSLAAAIRLGWLRGKLIEINLVLIVVKLALIVLAMVFSSTPLPFETVVSGRDLYGWWLMVLVVYCIASDFFQVVRTVAYVELWSIWRNAVRVPTNPTA